MIPRRSLLTHILLTIVTFGFYGFYFYYSFSQDMNTICDGDGEETAGLLKFILLSFVTCGIYSIYWIYKVGNRLQTNAPRYGYSFVENGTTLILWMLIGSLMCGIGAFISMHIMFKNFNTLADAYNGNTNYNQPNQYPPYGNN